MINLTLSNKQLVMIEDSGKITHWKGYDKDDFFFSGISYTRQGSFAYSVKEMILNKIRIKQGDSYYPILCDSKGNYFIVKHKINNIEYIEKGEQK